MDRQLILLILLVVAVYLIIDFFAGSKNYVKTFVDRAFAGVFGK
jgi:hypothetical protein